MVSCDWIPHHWGDTRRQEQVWQGLWWRAGCLSATWHRFHRSLLHLQCFGSAESIPNFWQSTHQTPLNCLSLQQFYDNYQICGFHHGFFLKPQGTFLPWPFGGEHGGLALRIWDYLHPRYRHLKACTKVLDIESNRLVKKCLEDPKFSERRDLLVSELQTVETWRACRVLLYRPMFLKA